MVSGHSCKVSLLIFEKESFNPRRDFQEARRFLRLTELAYGRGAGVGRAEPVADSGGVR
jgi:hypothetical protein